MLKSLFKSRRVLKGLLATAAAFVVSASASVASADDANPMYASWANCKPGTSVKSEMSTEAAGQKTKVTTTTTLVEVANDKVTVEMKMATEANGQKFAMPANKMDIAKGGGSATPPATGNTSVPGADVKQSDEDVTIAGKSYKCHVIDTTAKVGDNTTHSKVWTSTEVPGYMVKMETTTEGQFKSKTTSEVVEVTVK